MKTNEDVLNFFDAAIFYDYKNLGIIEELDQVRNCVINMFHETIPVSRILIALSNIDVVILKIFDAAIEDIIEKNHDLRAYIFKMISFERVVNEEEDLELYK